MGTSVQQVTGVEHSARKGDVKLFLWQKRQDLLVGPLKTIVFVHGSSMASQATFDLSGVPGARSAMDHFAGLGYDTWCLDMEGYGRSDKHRSINSDVSTGADDLSVGVEYICRSQAVESVYLYGLSSGALRAALYAQRHPERVARLALDAFVWTGAGSRTLEDRRKRLPELRASSRRAIDRAFIRSIFTRDHPGTADPEVVEAVADAILALDSSMPTGTYVDMCASLPIVDPSQITAPTLIMRGQFDGLASLDDLLDFFKRLPSQDKHFAIMPGIAHSSLHEKNYEIVYHTLASFFGQPARVYAG